LNKAAKKIGALLVVLAAAVTIVWGGRELVSGKNGTVEFDGVYLDYFDAPFRVPSEDRYFDFVKTARGHFCVTIQNLGKVRFNDCAVALPGEFLIEKENKNETVIAKVQDSFGLGHLHPSDQVRVRIWTKRELTPDDKIRLTGDFPTMTLTPSGFVDHNDWLFYRRSFYILLPSTIVLGVALTIMTLVVFVPRLFRRPRPQRKSKAPAKARTAVADVTGCPQAERSRTARQAT
jgi:hypothetical protein